MRLASKLTLALICGMCMVLSLYGYLSVQRERALFASDMRRDEHLMGRALALAVAEVWRSEGNERALQSIAAERAWEDGVRVRWVWLDAQPGDRDALSGVASELTGLAQGSEVVRVHRDSRDSRGRFYTLEDFATRAAKGR